MVGGRIATIIASSIIQNDRLSGKLKRSHGRKHFFIIDIFVISFNFLLQLRKLIDMHLFISCDDFLIIFSSFFLWEMFAILHMNRDIGHDLRREFQLLHYKPMAREMLGGTYVEGFITFPSSRRSTVPSSGILVILDCTISCHTAGKKLYN